MVRKTGQFPANRLNDQDRGTDEQEDDPRYTVAVEDTFDDVFIRAPHLPGIRAGEPAPEPQPAAGEDNTEDTAARHLASKFAPQEHQRIKLRRPRQDRPTPDRLRLPILPIGRKSQFSGDHPVRQDYPQENGRPHSARRRLYWSLCAGTLIVAGTLTACSFAGPLSGLFPARVSGFVGDQTEPTPVAPALQAPLAAGNLATDERNEQVALVDSQKIDPGPSTSGQAAVDEVAPEALTETTVEATRPEPATVQQEKSTLLLPEPARQPSAQASLPATPAKPAAKIDKPVASVAPVDTAPLSTAKITALLARGEKLLLSGDVVSARLLYLRVAEAGDRRGAKGVAMTYDPDVYARLPVAGLTPDREMAAIWYRKAGGDTTVTVKPKSAVGAPVSITPSSPERNAACARKYRSFDPATGLYTAHSGTKRPCRLP